MSYSHSFKLGDRHFKNRQVYRQLEPGIFDLG